MKTDIATSQTLTTFFDKIEKLTKLQRILIFGGTLLILIGSFIYFSYFPKYKKIDTLKKDYKQVKAQLAKAQKNAKQLDSYREKMKKAEADFQIARKALPEKKEIPSLLASISQSGQDVGLEFLLFKPKPEKKKDFYAEIPVSIKVTGNYHNAALFFDKVASLSRIVNIRDIKMVPQKGSDKLTTSCTSVTYKFIEDTEKKKKSKNKKKNKKRNKR
jgi:type IV pilus assembly protein PilO